VRFLCRFRGMSRLRLLLCLEAVEMKMKPCGSVWFCAVRVMIDFNFSYIIVLFCGYSQCLFWT
jgi:hypothetical protein